MGRFFKFNLVILLAAVCLMAACSAPESLEPVDAEPVAPAVEVPIRAPVVAAPAPTATPVPMPEPTVGTGLALEGRRGGVVTVAAQSDVPHRDVHQEFQATLTALGPGMAYSRLLRLETGPSVKQPSMAVECDLCESWKLTPDFAYEFKLRPGVRWHDIHPVNGREVKASDLVFSYERMQTPGWPHERIFKDRGIGRFTAPNDNTLRMELDFLDSDALLALADGHSKIVSPVMVEVYGDLMEGPVVGTGPWVWESTEAGAGTVLNANPAYFEEGLPFLDRLNIKIVGSGNEVSSGAQRLAAFRAGQLDVMTLPPQEWRQLHYSQAPFNSLGTREPGWGMTLTLNTRAAPLDRLRVRQAVLQAIDPWNYIDLIWAGKGTTGVGMPAPDPEWLLSAAELRTDYVGSPSRAREILAEEDLELPVEVRLAVGEFDPAYLKMGQGIAEDLRQVGFKVTVEAWNPAHYYETLVGESKDYELALGALPPAATPNGFMLGLLHSQGPGNVVGHRDRALDLLIQEQASELDQELRRELVLDVQRRVLGQGYMFSPVLASSQWVFDWEVKGFYPNTALSEYNHWSRVWLEE